MTDIPETLIETERLIIRKMTMDDLPWLIEMRGDPDVYRYLGGWERQNPDAVARRMPFYFECYEEFGYGQCAMIWKATGEPIGASGLQPLEDSGEIEVGYSIKKDFWRMGIGYECAQAWLKYGFETAGLERIVAVANQENKGSWRIMEKCGMHFEKYATFYGVEDLVFYAITRDEFLAHNNLKTEK